MELVDIMLGGLLLIVVIPIFFILTRVVVGSVYGKSRRNPKG
jgi:hypothetical protein